MTNTGEELPEEIINEFLKISSTIQEKLSSFKDGQENKYPTQGDFYREMMEQEFETRNFGDEMRELGRDWMCWFSKLQANIDGSDSMYSTSLEEHFAYKVSSY